MDLSPPPDEISEEKATEIYNDRVHIIEDKLARAAKFLLEYERLTKEAERLAESLDKFKEPVEWYRHNWDTIQAQSSVFFEKLLRKKYGDQQDTIELVPGFYSLDLEVPNETEWVRWEFVRDEVPKLVTKLNEESGLHYEIEESVPPSKQQCKSCHHVAELGHLLLKLKCRVVEDDIPPDVVPEQKEEEEDLEPKDVEVEEEVETQEV